ncbi:ABC transporter substrate-binding protein [Paenibacillus filicis]|uniref:ABC transporter substrate-binding protein n=1 Tax=Paenibacillus gyeongsangnamensis TaxID=3388067 RepID=A0ABT4QA03_9BACL|nr:ABC transporter substrate-binding protein [Paenibacillus filicis]MCZ8513717.1 ABC transporter substrate-binding protein [Paenibacillus filicis]
MKMTKKPFMLAAFAALVTTLAACSGGTGTNTASSSAKGSGVVEITFTNWLSVEDATKNIFTNLVTEFEKENPNIKIKSVGIPFNQFKDQVLVMSMGGNAPDVMQSNQNYTSAFAGAGIAEPLDSLLGPDIVGDIIEGSKQGVTYNGKLMAMPWTPHPNSFFWNKTLFKKAGLDPEQPPKTYAEMLEMAKKITALKTDEQGKPIYGLGLSSSSSSNTGNFLLSHVMSFGGKFVDDKGAVVFDQGSALKDTLDMYRTLISSNVSPKGGDIKDLRALFGNGTLGMTIDGDFARNIFRDASGKGEAFDKEWGVTVIPVNKTGKSETIFTEHQLLISKDSKQKEAAATFVKWLVSKDAMTMYHKSNGVLSARKSIAALPEMNEDQYAKTFNEQMKTASALPTANPKFDNAMKESTSMIQLVTDGNGVDDVISKVMPKIKDMYK